MLLQVVNLKEARDFSTGKEFIYVFKVITFLFLLFRNFSQFIYMNEILLFSR